MDGMDDERIRSKTQRVVSMNEFFKLAKISLN